MKNILTRPGRTIAVLIASSLAFFMMYSLQATPAAEFTIQIRDHRFSPDVISVPANQKIKLIVKNNDPTPEEFESIDLDREKIVMGNAEIVVFIGPLKPGVYRFFGDFNEKTAQGIIKVSKENKKETK